MKKIAVKILMVFFVLGVMCSPGWAAKGRDSAVIKEVQTYFDKVAAMLDKKDLDGVANTAIPGATLQYANGSVVTIEEWKAMATKEFADLASMKSRFKIEKVVDRGDTRIVVYSEWHSYKLAKEMRNQYTYFGRWTVTLAKMGQGWKVTHFIEHSEKTMRNGKVCKPQPGETKKKK